MTDPVPTARPATTVLLLRDRPDGFEVFMVKRSMESKFMPGAYVFPGGRVDPEDHDDADAWGGLDPELAHRRFEGNLEHGSAVAHLVAGAREVHEEVGVRLSSLNELHVLAHWITPEFEARRFDTWFVVCRLPDGATPVHDDYETIESRWVEPKSALERYGDGDMVMAPPTFYTIWDLARYGTAADVLSEAEARSVPPILPRFQQVDDRLALLLPGDPLYPSESPVPGPTRVVMGDGGRWWVVKGASA
jgi:8-oxo-dGTP pyrophosphatase MutT (NUDIX family)